MAAPTIPNGEEYFFPIIYEGTGGGQRVGKFVPFTDNGTIANSLIFNDGDNPKLNRTISSAGNRDTFTMSFWIKRCGGLGTLQVIFQHGADINNCTQFAFDTSNRIKYEHVDSGSNTDQLISNRTFEDPSKFYHIVLAVDTTQSTEANRVRIYVDGDEITSWNTANYPSQNVDTDVNSETGFYISSQISGTQYPLDCYLAEVNFVDGTQYTPSTFGVTDTSTGRWIPKTLSGITYGSNGFRLTFADSSALGDDTSGNTNDFTATNLATTDQTTDSPTQNFATFSPSFSSSTLALSEGNLTVTNGSSGWETAFVGKPVQSGKWYFEATVDVAGTYDTFFGVNTLDSLATNKAQYNGYADGSAGFTPTTAGSGDIVYHGNNGSNYYYTGASTTFSNGDKAGIAYDADTGAFWMAKNNTWISSGNPSTGANPLFSGFTAGQLVYFGLSNGTSGAKHSVNFGQRSFAYTPPTGFVALQQDNMPETAKGVSGLVWMKNRDATDSHQLYDSSRGKHKDLQSDATNAESTTTDGLQKFLKGGQAIEDDVSINTSGESYVSWNWVGSSGSTSSNSNGSITSTVQANTTAGFSIVEYTGTGSNATVGHGLSLAPECFIVKELGNANAWVVSHKGMTNQTGYSMLLNTTAAEVTASTVWNSTAPTSSVFSIGTDTGLNRSSGTYVAYCWHGVDGFSKFGKYTGNGNADGVFVYTGFKPAWIMIKETGNTNDWMIWDNARFPLNPTNNSLFANLTQADNGSSIDLDVLSNGFKCRTNNSQINRSSGSYVYMAFAEHPFVGDGTNPVTAR